MPLVLLTAAVTYRGAHVPAGEVIDIPEKSAAALIREGLGEPADDETAALLVSKTAQNGPESTETGGGGQTPAQGTENAADAKAGGNPDALAAALDKKYTRDPLADAAKAAGVEFAYDAKKGEIIQAVIAAGKADELLA